MRHRHVWGLLALFGALAPLQAQEASEAAARADAAEPAATAGAGSEGAEDPEALLLHYDADGDASLDLAEFTVLYQERFVPSSAEEFSRTPPEADGFLGRQEDRPLAEIAAQGPADLQGALILDGEGTEVGRISRLVIDREAGEYHAVIPAGKLVELVGIEFMTIPLSHLRIREDVLLLDDLDAVQPFEEERFLPPEEADAGESASSKAAVPEAAPG